MVWHGHAEQVEHSWADVHDAGTSRRDLPVAEKHSWYVRGIKVVVTTPRFGVVFDLLSTNSSGN